MTRSVRFTTRKRKSGFRPSAKLQAVLRGKVPKVKRGTPEHDAQAALFKDYIWPRLVAGAVAFAIPNGGHRHKKVAAELRDEGLTPGAPDIFIMHAGTTYFLEMKAPKGSLDPEQKVMIARLQAAGAVCAVAKGLEAAIRQLEAWGLLTAVPAALDLKATGRMAA